MPPSIPWSQRHQHRHSQGFNTHMYEYEYSSIIDTSSVKPRVKRRINAAQDKDEQQSSPQSPLCFPPAQAWTHALRGLWIHGWVDKMRAESAPERWLPSINGTGAFLLGPVLLSCVCALRQWPKFMIACICAPGRIMHAEQRPNGSPPCDTTAPVCGLKSCFYEPPFIRSPDSTRTYTLVRARARARSTHAASYQACFPCCRSMRHRGWM
ncbi:hypothetical protein V8C34DRAFT_183277 [Trichoderma compactum]